MKYEKVKDSFIEEDQDDQKAPVPPEDVLEIEMEKGVDPLENKADDKESTETEMSSVWENCSPSRYTPFFKEVMTVISAQLLVVTLAMTLMSVVASKAGDETTEP